MGLRFAKMDADLDSHPKIRKAGRLGREVFLFVLRQNAVLDRVGRVPASRVEPWYLADRLMMTEAEAETGLVKALAAGLIVRDGDAVSIIGWTDEWAKAPLSDAERQKRKRDKIDTVKNPADLRENVTDRHGVTVTPRDCHENHGSEEKRSEEKRGEDPYARSCATVVAPPLKLEAPALKVKRKRAAVAMSADWIPNVAHTAKALAAGLDCAAEAERFRDYHAAKGSTFADWDAAFRTWLGNAQRFTGSRYGASGNSGRNNPTETALASLREAEELERREGAA